VTTQNISINVATAEAMQALAASISEFFKTGDCLLLHGDLGAGKTTFARGFIHHLCGGNEEVVSPTFTLVQTYKTASGVALWHFDLYRLKHSSEVQETGLDDALNSGISLIEWPEIIEEQLPDDALGVYIGQVDNGLQRAVNIVCKTLRWSNLISTLKKRA